MASPHSFRLHPAAVILALASGTALVGVAGFGMWRAAEQAQARNALQVERDADDTARAMRTALQQPAVLDLFPSGRRFELVEGEPVIEGPELAWLDPLPRAADPMLDEAIRQTQIAEFVDGDPDAAERRFDALLDASDAAVDDAPARRRRERVEVCIRAAWQSRRAGRPDRCARLIEQARQALGTIEPADLRDVRLAHAFAALVRLERVRNGADPAEGHSAQRAHDLSLLAFAPSEVSLPTLARRAEEDPRAAAALDVAKRRVARRDLLRQARAFVREEGWREQPRRRGDHIGVWFPASDPSTPDLARAAGDAQTGCGALLHPTDLRALFDHEHPRLPPCPRRGRLVLVQPEDPAARTVVAGAAWIVPLLPPAVPWFVRPAALLFAAGGLLLLFGASAWATVRGLSRANAAMRARTDFLSGVTHELKTPIASMRLIADVLSEDRDELGAAQSQRYLEMLTGEAARLTTLIDNVLDLGQIERGERGYDLQVDCAADAVRETVRNYAELARRHGLTLQLTEGVAHAPAVIDRSAIAQALRNLLENARKYASSGGRVEISTGTRQATFFARVRDHGPGVPAAERSTLFERFVRGRAQQTGTVPGVGLGLFLSREILRHHGGELRLVDTGDGGPGAAFEWTLPLADPHPESNATP